MFVSATPPIAMNFEQKHVHKFYNKKAKVFSNLRLKPWPFAAKFIKERLTPDELILDAGCGNGRFFIRPNTIGLDYSEPLLKEASTRPNAGLIRGDVHALPFRDGTFDAVLSIAVLHHVSTAERRLTALCEARRVLKKGGRLLIYVWHKEAAKHIGKFRPIGEDEYLVNWQGESEDPRYYYLYDEDSLRKVVEEAGFEVEEMGREYESIYAILSR